MKSSLTILGVIAALLFLNSCSIEKRVYNPGYHIEWRTKRNENTSKLEKVDLNKDESATVNQEVKIIPDTSNSGLIVPIETNTSTSDCNATSTKTSHIPTVSQLLKNNNVLVSLKKENGAMAQVLKENTKSTRADGMAIVSMVVGIISWFTPLALAVILAILAIIFGAVGLSRIKKNPEELTGKGMAKTGIILGIVGLIIVMAVASMI